jgi:hypothetical protein
VHGLHELVYLVWQLAAVVEDHAVLAKKVEVDAVAAVRHLCVVVVILVGIGRRELRREMGESERGGN